MNSSCCEIHDINDLDNHFDQAGAREDAEDYVENGLSARGEKMLAYLDTKTPGFVEALDIGCGVGALHQEMLLRGLVKHVVGVDASSAYLAAAKRNAETFKVQDLIDYIQEDFAQTPEVAPAADVVLLDRVICCYPKLEGLLAPAASKAKHLLVLSYPREGFFIRLEYVWRRLLKILTRSKFRLYYHDPKRVLAIVAKAGLRSVYEEQQGEWQISTFERVGAS